MDHTHALFLSFRQGTAEDDLELCKAVYPPQKVQKLIEVLKLYTNGFSAIGKAESVRALWEHIKKIILASEEEAFMELSSLKYCREKYIVADPFKHFKEKTTFQLQEGSSKLLLQGKHSGTQRTCYNLSAVPKFLAAPLITKRNWVDIAHMICVCMEEKDLQNLEASWGEYQPAQKKALKAARDARAGNTRAFHSADVEE